MASWEVGGRVSWSAYEDDGVVRDGHLGLRYVSLLRLLPGVAV
jgi:hypothetical protein